MSYDNLKIEIPELDTENGLNLCSGNKNLYIKSLCLFVKNVPATLDKIRSVTENSLKSYTAIVHSIKGMCDYIGAVEARKTAKYLENTADSGDFKIILEQNGPFIEKIEKIISNIHTWLDNNNISPDIALS